MDVHISDEGNIFLFQLLTDAARAWVAEHVPDDALYFGRSLVVEHHYAGDLAASMVADGLEVV